jgi:hypothetical protein
VKEEIKLNSIDFSKEFIQIDIQVPDAKEKKTKSIEASEPPKKEVNMDLDMGVLITQQKRELKRDEIAL